MYVFAVAAEAAELGAGRDVPEFDGFVVTAAGEGLTVRCEGDCKDCAIVTSGDGEAELFSRSEKCQEKNDGNGKQPNSVDLMTLAH